MRHTTNGLFAGGAQLANRGVWDQTRLVWRLLRDERVPALKFALPMLVFLYVVSPLDFIPDVFLGIGQTDDAGIAVVAALLALRVIPKLAPRAIVHEHLEDMANRGSEMKSEQPSGDDVIEARYSVR